MKFLRLGFFAICFIIASIMVAQTPGQFDPSAMMQNVQDIQKDMERLKAMKPMTNDELKAWLPEAIGELKSIKVTVGNGHTGMVAVTASYNTTDEPEFLDTNDGRDIINTKNKTFVIEVMDGAGSGADMFSGLAIMSSMNFETEDENKQVKKVDVNGIEAQQTYYKKQNKTELQFVYESRFIVAAKGNNLNPEETWRYLEEFDLNGLGPQD